jgi:hypothetical protein
MTSLITFMTSESKFIFIYNANGGIINSIVDAAHKIISPATYNCHLCTLTHHLSGEKKVWTKFREQFGSDFVLLHKDEFEKQYDQIFTYPVVLKTSKNGIAVVLTRQEIIKLNNVGELIEKVRSNLNY